MSIIKRMRKQTAIVWQKTGQADRYGKFAYLAPIQIACRWEDGSNQFMNDKGEIAYASSKVFVDRMLTIGDKAMLGELDSNTPDDPTTITGPREIKQFEQLPNLRNTETLYTAYLL